VVTKLVSLFSNKSSSQETSATGAAATKSTSQKSTTTKHNNPSPAVQFKNLSPNNNINSRNNNQLHKPSNSSPNSSYPPISPARSGQSSVSAGDSSYNPTGWPGTVDKRGKTYVMEPSYSESEEGSYVGTTTSPRNKMHKHSFDGDSQAELEDWIHGDSSSKMTGPIDLDEAYEQRHHVSGWREGHGQSLTDISETRTAADFHLEEALRTSNGGVSSMDSHNLSKPYPLGQGRNVTNREAEMHSSPGSVSSLLDEESIRRGIDTRLSEGRVRASGRNVVRNIPLRERVMYDDEVDFGECDDDVSFDEFSPDDIDVGQSFHRHPSDNRCDDEVDFEYSPDDFSKSPLRIQPPTEEALRLNDSRSAMPRPGGSVSLKGYRGFIEKTRDVPNLMDDLESEANTSLGTNAERRALGLSLPPPTKPSIRNSGLPPRPSSVVSSNVDSGSDVFEGIAGSSVPSITSVSGPRLAAAVTNNLTRGSHSFVSEYESFDPRQTHNPFRQQRQSQLRRPANNFDRKVDFVDPSLNLSAVTRGSADAYSHHDLVDLDDFVDDGFDIAPDLSIYCIPPESVRLMVRAFRKMCTMQMEISSCEDTMLSEFEDLVDTKKRFALFEMRSRIMETDIDRGLERRGGTNIVDDIVLTPYFQALHRVRDAVIVSKAWRDGATPKDVVTAHLLTRRSAKSHFVRRPVQQQRRPGAPSYPQYWLEEVTWLDETDFSMMRCQSLGAGTMKGLEMFTIGDCQRLVYKAPEPSAQ
jgi:hypothetical protein